MADQFGTKGSKGQHGDVLPKFSFGLVSPRLDPEATDPETPMSTDKKSAKKSLLSQINKPEKGQSNRTGNF